MPAPRKYPDEMRERAIRLVLDVVDEAGNVTAACRRIGEQLGINADTRRGWVKQAQIDAGKRPGTTSGDTAHIRQLERENAELRRQRDLAHRERFFRGRARPPLATVIGYIDAHRGQFGVGPACRALTAAGVPIAPGTCYAARSRPSARALRDAALLREIRRVHKDSDGTYGAWKVWRQLNRDGIGCARCTVERLMRQAHGRPRPHQAAPLRALVAGPGGGCAPDWKVWFSYAASLIRCGQGHHGGGDPIGGA